MGDDESAKSRVVKYTLWFAVLIPTFVGVWLIDRLDRLPSPWDVLVPAIGVVYLLWVGYLMQGSSKRVRRSRSSRHRREAK